MVLVATQVKRRRGTTAENDAFTGAEGEITVDTEKHELRVHDGETQGGFVIGGGSGSGRNVGDIFYTTRTDTGLAGAVECNGGTYNTEDYTGAGSIGELLEGGLLDYVSFTDYATAISTKGYCDKIGWDGTGTTSFRVPTLTPHIIQTNNIPVITDGEINITSGNLTGNLQLLRTASDNSQGRLGIVGTTTSSLSQPIIINSGIIADTSDTAQLRVMIQLFNGTTDEAVATVGTVVAQVGELRNMSNITATGKETVVGWGMPDYSAGVVKTHNTLYQAETDGIVRLCIGTSNHNIQFRYGNDSSVSNVLSVMNGAGVTAITGDFFVPKGTYYQTTGTLYANANMSNTIIFYPCKK